ncbi:CTP synthase C-terminal region-related (seleno)protein [Dokdonella sp.]|uniref:CTP synthase C-terminal region-related (seleno)protein n=1 Tax=Dokdonella sp. TaxID=2291710 RepID=UPI002F3FCC45
MRSLRIGLIGDRDDAVVAHRAIPRALALAGAAAAQPLDVEWLGTETIDGVARLAAFDGLWCVPASPYRDMDGALRAIRHAREARRPFLGTCGGFQHAVVEYARNVLGWADAEHAETAPDAERAVVVPLSCALVEVHEAVHLVAGSRCARAWGVARIDAGYHCRYGLAAGFRAAIADGPLRVAAVDATGEVRALELDGHPFFVATLFQHERAALDGRCPPLVRAFVDAVAGLAIGRAA